MNRFLQKCALYGSIMYMLTTAGMTILDFRFWAIMLFQLILERMVTTDAVVQTTGSIFSLSIADLAKYRRKWIETFGEEKEESNNE